MSAAAATAVPAAAKPQTLDELMLAMDVVDTIRHRDLLVERELGQGDRDNALRNRLREIYTSQGIEVTDRVIDEGIKALKESRFVYTPSTPGFARSLALIWVRRSHIAKWTSAFILAVAAIGGIVEYGVIAPRKNAEQVTQIELTATLPKRLNVAYHDAKIEVRTREALQQLEALYRDGRHALNYSNAAATVVAIEGLEQLRDKLLLTYQLMIVSRPGESSGVWRVPGDNPSARNYYLVVEAIAPDGGKLTLPIRSEETGITKNVSKWGVRVREQIFDSIKRDKEDNGIIDSRIVGEKRRGELTPRHFMAVDLSAITEWDE